MSVIEFGVSTHIVGSIIPEHHFALFARYGFSLVELNLGYFPFLEDEQKFQRLRDLLVRNGIRVYSFHLPYGETVPSLGKMDISHPDPHVRRNTVGVIRLCLERLMALNARCLVVHPSVGGMQDAEQTEQEARLAYCLESLQQCQKIIKSLRSENRRGVPVQIALETLLPASWISKAYDLCAILERLNSDSFGLCLDVNHINLAGQNPIAFTRQIGSYVITTHLSDNNGINEKHWIPGSGVIPWKEWLSALVACGYPGPFMYETTQRKEVSDDETVAETRRNAEELSAMIKS